MSRTDRAWPLLRGALVIGVAASLAYAFVITWGDIRAQGVPHWSSLCAAYVLLVLATGCGGRSWSSLFSDREDRRRALKGFVVSQTSKYLPAGGVFQLGTQVSMSSSETQTRGDVAGLTLIHLWLTVVAGTIVGAVVLLPVRGFSIPFIIALALAATLTIVGLRRAFITGVAGRLGRLSSRLPAPSIVPEQKRLLIAAAGMGASFVLQGIALALLARQFDPDGSFSELAGAFAWAWVAGFVVLPLPSGLGVREAALVALVPSFTSGAIIAASLVQRGLTIVAEVTLAGAVVWWNRRNPADARELE